MEIEPFRPPRPDLTIPGVGTRIAEVVLAETGADMTRFPTAADLASWAGVCPGNNESAGRVKSAKTRHGDPCLKAALGAAASPRANRTPTSVPATGASPPAAAGEGHVAVQHTILTAIWHMAQPAPYTTTPAPTTSPASTQNASRPEQSTNSKHGIRITLDRVACTTTAPCHE